MLSFLIWVGITTFIFYYLAFNCYKVDKEVSRKVSEILDRNDAIEEIGYGEVKLKGIAGKIWILNYPYAYGNINDTIYLDMKTRRKLARYIALHGEGK